LPPGLLQQLIPIRILSVETLRADCMEGLSWNKQQYQSGSWCEQIDAGESEILARYDNGEPAIVSQDRTTYIGTLTNREFLLDFFQQYCQQANIQTYRFSTDIRVCQRGDLMFAFNYSDQPQELPLDSDASLMLGSTHIEPHSVTVWRASGS
jgi:beta-galactosidase